MLTGFLLFDAGLAGPFARSALSHQDIERVFAIVLVEGSSGCRSGRAGMPWRYTGPCGRPPSSRGKAHITLGGIYNIITDIPHARI